MADTDSKSIRQALAILEEHKNKPLSETEREKKTIELAALMLHEALDVQTSEEKSSQKEIARMMRDPRGKSFTMMMTDECFRSKKTKRVADQLIYLLDQFGIPQYLGPIKRLQLKLFKIFGKAFHFILVPIAVGALRKTTSKVILPGEKEALSAHMAKRRQEGVRLNLNHLGEAILGEQEALHRLHLYLLDLEQGDVEYISIKISTIFSQINLLDWDRSLEILADRLRQLYRKARDHRFRKADGTEVPKFVNLDMEEYRDLLLTKDLFKKVLDEGEFLEVSAGIVLQAYIPDSYLIQQDLTEWAMKRYAKGGAPIKIRIVKGANLAMEQFEASLRCWPQTPYKTKAEVDANYKRMVLYGCRGEHAAAVHLGIASHNLFDIAFAMLARVENGVEKEVSFEMLEGMADHIRRVVQHLTGDILLYCPIATKKDFQSAIAYLIRRLDENTGPENFLRHSFGLKPGTPDWKEQVQLFSKACREMNVVETDPRRTQNRFDPPQLLKIDSSYECEADTDFSLPQNQKWILGVIEEWKKKEFDTIPLVIGGKEIQRDQKGAGFEPSNPHDPCYQYSLATWNDIDQALQAAKSKESQWRSKSVRERCELIAKAAYQMRVKRADLAGVMMKDGGKTAFETDPEISEAIDFAEYYLRNMLDFEKMEEIAFSPVGTVLVAPPWNFPISIPAGGIIAALVTGNCVIFKPAPEAVLSGWILANIFWEAGIPKEVLQFVNCVDDPVGSQLIKDQRLNAIILTGGTSTARLFYKMRPSIRLSAETGGKNAMIISGMSDRDLAIKDMIQSAFGHSGQKCSALSLAILEAEVYDDPNFLRQFKDAVESIRVGPNWDLSSKVIPMIRAPEKTLLKGLKTLERGEKWLVEPKQDPQNPNLWSPGVKLGVKEGSFMHQTELFGPVLAVMRAKNLEEAIRFANGTPYGLTSGLHSLDKREISYWVKHIESGNCYVNRGITGAVVQRQPFGGCKASSFGHGSKAGGPNYIAQFMYKKQVGLPKEKVAVSTSINELTGLMNQIDLSSEELGTWFASTANYCYWAPYFAREHDPSKVVGEDNLLLYVPRKKMAFRIHAHDKPIDIFRVLAAALACKVKLDVSFDPQDSPIKIDDAWRQGLKEFNLISENAERFYSKVKGGAYERIRLVSKPSAALELAASEKGVYLNAEPVLASGRLELLHYLREVALSIDYHRYGNLGTREGEKRAPIL